MELITEFENIKVNSTLRVGHTQSVVSSDVRLEGGRIKKLLTISSDAVCERIEKAEDSAIIYGCVRFKIIYADADGKVCGGDFAGQFAESVSGADMGCCKAIYAAVDIVDADTQITDSGLRLQTVLDISVYGVTEHEKKALFSAEGALTDSTPYCADMYKGMHNQCLTVQESWETYTAIEKVIFCDASASLSEAVCADGTVTVSGEAAVNIAYIAGGEVCTHCVKVPLSDVMPVDFAAVGDSAEVSLSVSDCKIVLTGTEDNNCINCTVNVNAQAIVYSRISGCMITDLVSPRYMLDVTREKLDYTINGKQCFYNDKINGIASLDADMPKVEKVMASFVSRNTVAGVQTMNGRVVVEGILTASVLYTDDAGMLECVQVELPYSLPFQSDNAAEGDRAVCTASASCLTARLKRDRELDVQAELNLAVTVYSEKSVECVTRVEITGENLCDMPPISVYNVPMGTCEWSLVKTLMMPMDKIMRQNPGLSGGVEGKRIIVYRE